MVNINKLRGKVVELGFSIESLAELVNVDRSTMYRKLSGKGDGFTIKEVDAICKALKLSKEDALAIFFTQYVA